jgi:hypothetical protein
MCALLTGCDNLPLPPALLPGDFASCVSTMSQQLSSASAIDFSLTIRECGLSSTSCAALRTCALHGAKPQACTGRGTQGEAGYCDIDGRAVKCLHERVVAVRDCPRGGEQCSVRGGEAGCSLGPCVSDGGQSAPACSASGTRIVSCDKGRLLSLDCSAFGLQCVQGQGGPACAPRTAACADGAKRCDASIAVACYNGHEVRVDCGAAGLDCQGAPGSTPVGACASPPPPSGACDPNAKPTCDGASVKYCHGGTPRSYLCKTLGLSRCVSDARGARCAS